MKRHPIPIERARELLSYDPNTGELRWCVSRGKAKAGSLAGCLDMYIVIQIDGQSYYAHRLAWAMHHGREPGVFLDHRNRDKTDNRITNLREVTNSQNLQNRAAANVCFYKAENRWRAAKMIDGTTYTGSGGTATIAKNRMRKRMKQDGIEVTVG